MGRRRSGHSRSEVSEQSDDGEPTSRSGGHSLEQAEPGSGHGRSSRRRGKHTESEDSEDGESQRGGRRPHLDSGDRDPADRSQQRHMGDAEAALREDEAKHSGSARTAKSKHNRQLRCYLCGRHGHVRTECPGLEDDGAGQSKYKGKYSKLPASVAMARSAASGAAEAEPPKAWWPAAAKDVAVDDWCCRLHRLFERAKHQGSLKQLQARCPHQWPMHLRMALVALDEPQVLLAESASPWFQYWEEPRYALTTDDRLRFSFGLAPASAGHWSAAFEQELEQLASHAQCIAIGVTGLDFSLPDVEKRQQVDAFLGQLRLAQKLKKVLLVTVAGGAEAEVAAGLQRTLPAEWPIVLVAYRGKDPDWVVRLMAGRPGLRIAFDGSLTFSKAKLLQNIAADCSRERMLLASQAPDLRPTSLVTDDDWSHPGHMIATAEALASVLRLDTIAELLETTAAASQQLLTDPCLDESITKLFAAVKLD